MAQKRKHFELLSDEDVKIKRISTIPKATLKNNDKWDRVLCCYLEEIGAENTQYWFYPEEELDLVLSKFWFAVRTQRQPLDSKGMAEAMKITVIYIQNVTQLPVFAT